MEEEQQPLSAGMWVCGESVPLLTHVCPGHKNQGTGGAPQQASSQPAGGEVSQSAQHAGEDKSMLVKGLVDVGPFYGLPSVVGELYHKLLKG